MFAGTCGYDVRRQAGGWKDPAYYLLRSYGLTRPSRASPFQKEDRLVRFHCF